MPGGPCRIKCRGDIRTAKGQIGRARSQLDILEKSMTFQRLKQGARRVKLEDGTEVECNICFGLQQIHIYSPPVGIEIEEPLVGVCFCCCSWAVGTIREVVGEYGDPEIRYNVEVCQLDHYTLFESCIPTDFAQYAVDEQVIVLVVTDFETCCEEESTESLACSVNPEDESPLFYITPLHKLEGEIARWLT